MALVVHCDMQDAVGYLNLQIDHSNSMLDRVGHQLTGQQTGVVDDLVGDAPSIKQSGEERSSRWNRISAIWHLEACPQVRCFGLTRWIVHTASVP